MGRGLRILPAREPVRLAGNPSARELLAAPDRYPEVLVREVEIESIIRGLASEQPPTNPLVVLKAAQWWYIHGKGVGSDRVFRWAIEWARHLATDTSSDAERFDEFLEYLVTVGFADEQHELR